MNQRQWGATKWFIAVIAGIPVTLAGLYFIVTVAMFGAMAAAGGDLDASAIALGALWCIAGLAGLLGFWWWVLQRSPASWPIRLSTAILIALGVIAIAPLAFGQWSFLSLIGLAGIGAGLVAIGQSLLSNNALERT